MTTRRALALALALALAPAILAGCAQDLRYPIGDAPEADAVLRDVRSSMFLTDDRGGGTMTAIAPPLFVTAAHTFRCDDGRARVRTFGPPGDELEGIVRSGADEPGADWVVFEFPVLGDHVGWIDPDRALRIGERIWYVGFTGPACPTLDAAMDDHVGHRAERVFRGRVVEPWRSPREDHFGAIYGRLDDPAGVPRGISGGPTAVWDDALDRYVIVGINSFMWGPLFTLPKVVSIPFTTNPHRRGAIVLDREWVEKNHALAGRRGIDR